MKKSIYLFALLFSASFIFTACDNDEPVRHVSLQSTLTLTVDETQRLTATIWPANATNQNVTWASNNETVATVDADGVVTAVSLGTAIITVTTKDGSHTATCRVVVYQPYFDVGVEIDGTRWATRNVDAPGTFAPSPESNGMIFQWNRQQGWTTGNAVGWDNSPATGTIWERESDPCPQGWRVPTPNELNSLNGAGSIWTTRYGVNGRLYGTAPNQIFLPAAGLRNRNNGGLSEVGRGGNYWANGGSGGGEFASLLWLGDMGSGIHGRQRSYGFSVRCVAE